MVGAVRAAQTRVCRLHAWAASGLTRGRPKLSQSLPKAALRGERRGPRLRGPGRPGCTVPQRLGWIEPSRGPSSLRVGSPARRRAPHPHPHPHPRLLYARRHSLEPGRHFSSSRCACAALLACALPSPGVPPAQGTLRNPGLEKCSGKLQRSWARGINTSSGHSERPARCQPPHGVPRPGPHGPARSCTNTLPHTRRRARWKGGDPKTLHGAGHP